MPGQPAQQHTSPASPAWPSRGRARLRRRLAELRALQDQQLLNLGGLVFDLYRFGRRNDELVRSKLATLVATQREMGEIERQLDEARAEREVPHRSVGTCSACGTLYTSDSNFCRNCGRDLAGGHAFRAVTPSPGASTSPSALPDRVAGGRPASVEQPVAPAQPPREPQSGLSPAGGEATAGVASSSGPPPAPNRPRKLQPSSARAGAAGGAGSASEWLPRGLGGEPPEPAPAEQPPPREESPPTEEAPRGAESPGDPSEWHPGPLSQPGEDREDGRSQTGDGSAGEDVRAAARPEEEPPR